MKDKHQRHQADGSEVNEENEGGCYDEAQASRSRIYEQLTLFSDGKDSLINIYERSLCES